MKNHLYQKLLDEVDDYALYLLSPEGTIESWNKGAEIIKGYTSADVLGQHFRIFYTPEDIQNKMPEQLLAEAAVAGKVQTSGYRKRKNGSLFWGRVVVRSLYEDGNLKGFSKMVFDDTITHLNLDKLERSEKQFQDLAKNAPGVVYQWVENADGTFGFTFVSPRIRDIFGIAPEQMHRIVDYLHPEDRERWRLSIETSNRTGSPWSFEGRLLYPDGEVKWWRGDSVLSQQNKERKVYNGIMVDTTRQHQMQQQNRRQGHQLQMFVKHTPAAVAMFDTELRYLVASDRWVTDYGLQGRDIIGQYHYDIFPEIRKMPHWLAIHQRGLMGMTEACEEDPFLRADGHTDYIRWENRPWFEDDGTVGGIIMFTEVITERVENRRGLEQANKQLQAANDELSQFAYVASHDLQEPLRTVSSFVQLLKEECGEELSDDARQYIAFATEATGRMKALIDGLLTYSRLQTQAKKTSVPLATVVQRSLQNLHSLIANSQANVTVGDLPTVDGNEVLLEQLFQNLISNAIKYNRNEIPSVQIAATKQGGRDVVCVTDNGIGIDQAYREKIFKIFQRLHSSKEFTGSGIGLAICKKIVALHGGEIWVEEAPGGGSRFCFYTT